MSIKPEERIYDAAKKQHYFVWAISEHVSKVEPIFNRTIDYVERLETENAELRELCEDMYEWMGRAMYDGSARKYEYELIVSRMHDLGIEVVE